MEAVAAAERLRALAAGLDGESPDPDALGRVAVEAVEAAQGWTADELSAFQAALDEVTAAVAERHHALGEELGGVAQKGRAIRGYGRPMGVRQGTVAQRVCRRS
jgi:ABC-type transporter Mla subunit MlaD